MSEEKTKLSELISIDSIEKMQGALKLLDSIESVEIKTREQYENAAEIQKSVKKAFKDIETDRKGTVKPLNDQVKAVNNKYKEVTLKLDNGQKQIGSAMSIYYQEEQRKLALEQKKREAEAEEKRRKLESAAEKEAKKIADHIINGREDLAEKAQARMEDKLDEACTTVAAEVENKKISGVSYRTDYDLNVINKKVLIAQLLASPMTEHIVEINLSSLKAAVKASKGNAEFEGLSVTEKKTPVVRS